MIVFLSSMEGRSDKQKLRIFTHDLKKNLLIKLNEIAQINEKTF